jgi:hypothetical protein
LKGFRRWNGLRREPFMLVPVLFGGRMAHSESRFRRSVDVHGTFMHPNGSYSKPSKVIWAHFDSAMALLMSHLCSFSRFMAEGWLMWRGNEVRLESLWREVGSSCEPNNEFRELL